MQLHRVFGTILGVGASLFVGSGSAGAEGTDGAARATLERSVREYLFLNAQLGVEQRLASYADGSPAGPSGRSEGRVHINAQASGLGPFGAYVGAAVLGRLSRTTAADVGDPLLDPYDDFSARRNLRIFGAYGEYTMVDEDGRTRLVVRAGRLSNLDRDAGLLLCDGASVRLAATKDVDVEAYGGRRATLDRGFADGRDDLTLQLCGGARVAARFGDLSAEAGYRFEGAHRPYAGVEWWTPGLSLGLRGEAILGSDGDESRDPAIVIRTDGHFTTSSGSFAATWLVEGQINEDPRVYGRGGLLPRTADVLGAVSLRIDQSPLDRLFFGADLPHLRAYATVEQWLSGIISLQGGLFARIPLSSEDKSSMRPQIIEGWLGPELALARGWRVGTELRIAAEDPGDPGRLFGTVGDGERSRLGVRGWAELPFALNETMTLSVRPEVEGRITSTRGPLSETNDQTGIAAGVVASYVWDRRFRLAARYGIESLPEFFTDGVTTVHGAEVWLEGTY